MRPARIAELLAPFLGTGAASDQRLSLVGPEEGEGPDEALCQSISTYIDILARWNARINLTSIRDPENIVTRHFGESLFVARHLFPSTSSAPARITEALSVADGQAEAPPVPAVVEGFARLADVGSGAGFPGIPMKLWNPRIPLTLIESNHKKAAFLREVARTLTLTDINVFNGRAEDLPPAQAHFDVVTLRAVEHFEDVLPVSATLLVPGGRLALLIGSSQQDAAAVTLPSFSWGPLRPIPLSQSRVLLVGTSPAV